MSDNAGDLTKFRDEWRRELLSKEDPAHEVSWICACCFQHYFAVSRSFPFLIL